MEDLCVQSCDGNTILYDPSQWRHCPGKDNPADLLSRGVTAEQLKTMDVRWRGLSWLAQPPQYWPPNTPAVDVSLPLRKGSANHTLSVEVPRKLLDPTKPVLTGSYFGPQLGSCGSNELLLEGMYALRI